MAVEMGSDDAFELPIDQATQGTNVRADGLNEAQVTLLMELEGHWPAIVVWGPDNMVVDGAHRMAAARRLGLTRISAIRFSGTAEEAYLEAVRRNIDHGLPLSLEDRRRAVRRVITRHPDWSDRRIASHCGLSGKAVARLRREQRPLERPRDTAAPIVGMERRIGKDGKARPVQPEALRERISEAIVANPEASLRTIALETGASPETVRTVRARLNAVEGTAKEREEVVVQPIQIWEPDRALLSCGDAGEFARWFKDTAVGDEWRAHVAVVPVGRIYEVADEAHKRADAWALFAGQLEGRLRR
jgi:hypothetical protein